MEIYSREKVDSIIAKHEVVDEVIDKLTKLAIGEGLFISKIEWTPKSAPKNFLANRGVFDINSKTLETGWLLIKKVKR